MILINFVSFFCIVAAGRGIPSDYMEVMRSIDEMSHGVDGLNFPHTGHAIEVSPSLSGVKGNKSSLTYS